MKNSKTKKKSGVGKAIAVIALSAIMLAGGCIVGYGAGTHWTYKRGNVQTSIPDKNGVDNGGAILTPDKESDFQIKSRKLSRDEYATNGISPQAETAFTLTATILPEEAFDKSVDWSIAWQNAGSAWASGKNVSDYYSITATSDGSCTANAVCKQAFAEPVIIKCKLRNADIYATVKADYVSKLTLTFDMPTYCLGDGFDEQGLYHETWSIGTITGGTVNFGKGCIDMQFQGEVATAISSMPYGDYLSDNHSDIYYDGSCLSTPDDDNFNFYQHWDQIFVMENEYVNGDYTSQEKWQFELRAQNHIYKYFMDRFGKTEIPNGVRYDINYTYTIDGQTYTGLQQVYASFSTKFINVSATSVSIGQTQIKH